MKRSVAYLGWLLLVLACSSGGAEQGRASLPSRGLPVRYRPPVSASVSLEFRGAWLHWRDFASLSAIRATVAKAQRAGLNVLLPLANYPVMYRSAFLSLNPEVSPNFDPMQALVAEAHAVGLEVHPYFVLGNSGLTGIARGRPEWWVMDRWGRRNPEWVDLAKPEVRDFLTLMVSEVVGDGVDGIQFDYIRYGESGDTCYDPFCRAGFEQEFGVDPVDLLKGARPEGGQVALLQLPAHLGSSQGMAEWQAVSAWTAGLQPNPQVLEPGDLDASSSTILIATGLRQGEVDDGALRALVRFVRRGNALLIIDPPTAAAQDGLFGGMLGLAEVVPHSSGPLAVETQRGEPELALPGQVFAAGPRCRRATTSRVLARTEDGVPLVTMAGYANGSTLVFNARLWEQTPASLVLVSAVEWLGARTGIRWREGRSATPADWDEWRCRQVNETVEQMSTALRRRNPQLVISAAAGTRAEDKRHLFRDGKTWLAQGWVDYLCPMLYLPEVNRFRARLAEELQPLQGDLRLRSRIFPGVGAYRIRSSPTLLTQVQEVKNEGLSGTCFFAFEHLSASHVEALASGPFRRTAVPPWWR